MFDHYIFDSGSPSIPPRKHRNSFDVANGKRSPRKLSSPKKPMSRLDSTDGLLSMFDSAAFMCKVSRSSSSAEAIIEEGRDSDVDEYGFFDDCEPDHHTTRLFGDLDSEQEVEGSPARKMARHTILPGSISSFCSSFSSLSGIPETRPVLFVNENSKAPLSCRSFDNHQHQSHHHSGHYRPRSHSNQHREHHSNSSSGSSKSSTSSSLPVCISLLGFRIVQCEAKEEAEYQVKLIVDGVAHVAWKRYQDFSSLQKSCRGLKPSTASSDIAAQLNTQPTIDINTSNSTSIVAAMQDHGLSSTMIVMEHTCPTPQSASAAWSAVEQHRPWWFQPQHTTTSVSFLEAEAKLLEQFLHLLLFEVPSWRVLWDFVRV